MSLTLTASEIMVANKHEFYINKDKENTVSNRQHDIFKISFQGRLIFSRYQYDENGIQVGCQLYYSTMLDACEGLDGFQDPSTAVKHLAMKEALNLWKS